jgi:hypothetical protein
MASSGIDKWLKGLEDPTVMDPAELEQRMSALQNELEVVQLKIMVLEPLLNRARRRARRQEESRASNSPDLSAPAVAPERSDEPRTERPSTWKTDAVLTFLAEQPHRMFAPAEVRKGLRKMGLLEGDEGTPMPLLLRRLEQRGQVAAEDGRYGYMPEAGSDKPRTGTDSVPRVSQHHLLDAVTH